MSGSQIKGVHFRMPRETAKAVKIAAAKEEKSVQDWLREAAEEKLRQSQTEAA